MIEPDCPRCGYDLSGETATWSGPGASTCPVEGRCTECGLTFLWRDILNQRYLKPRGSVEHAERGFLGAGLLRAGAVTSVRVLVPWVLWRRMRLEHPIVWGRLALVFVLLALPGYAALVLTGGAVGGATADVVLYRAAGFDAWLIGLPQSGVVPVDVAAHLVYGLAVPFHPVWFVSGFGSLEAFAMLAPAMAHAVMGASFLTLFQTLGRIRVRRAHLVRAVAYGAGQGLGLGLLAVAVAGAVTAFAELQNSGAFFPAGAGPGAGVWGLSAPAVRPWYADIANGVGDAWLLVEVVLPVLALVQVVWLPVYWWCFAKRYLRLPRATFVVIMMLIITSLAMLALMFVTGNLF